MLILKCLHRLAPALAAALLLSGCGASLKGPQVRQGDLAYQTIPPPVGSGSIEEYAIGPLDTVDITVFQEPDISTKGTVVDASGNIAMPLIGTVHAAGLNATQLASVLETELSKKYYVKPQVTVVVSSSVSQQVTVQGEVVEPGIYQIKGSTTLLDAISLAKGESDNARTTEVTVIRHVNGERMAALFNIDQIRRGEAPDPAVLGKDVIIVGHSKAKQFWHDFLKAAPIINGLFYRL